MPGNAISELQFSKFSRGSMLPDLPRLGRAFGTTPLQLSTPETLDPPLGTLMGTISAVRFVFTFMAALTLFSESYVVSSC
jgi:hypothetical protein